MAKSQTTTVVKVHTPHAKLYCAKCERVEAFNFVTGTDMLERGASPSQNPAVIQVFSISLLCQACKSVPEVFLVRRANTKLTLCGRAPMESVQAPDDIPKSVARYYSDAVVAHQSRQTLAGVFLLRCLIEQWCLAQAPTGTLQADEALDLYMATLPDDFKTRFPSMRALYGDLSVDVHSATGSVELYEKAREQIIEHFQARRLFRLAARLPA